MNHKLWTMAVIVVAVGLGSVVHVVAQNSQPVAGHWQVVVSNGGDGGNAWRFNPDTGQSYFCYRQNCFAQTVMLPPTKP
jgi:hypothetical protein